jgi:xyloglucan-specific exo-beta-1,4-glucanase
MKATILLFFFFLSLSQLLMAADNYSWNSLRIGGGGYVTGIVTCETQQNLIYARTDVGGAYRWLEETQSWKALNDWTSREEMGYLGIESIAIDPQSPNRVYMSAGLEYFSTPPAILISEDYGDTFKKSIVPFMIHGNGYGRGTGERLVVDPNDSNILFCGTRKGGLWKSTDMAKTWKKVTGFPVNTTKNSVGVCVVVFDSSSGTSGTATKRIFAGVSRMTDPNLYVSEDAGETWNPVAGTPTDKMPQKIVINPAGYLYVTFANGAGPHGGTDENLDKGSLLKYHIETKTWTDITPNKTSGRAMSGISFAKNNPEILVASTTNTWWAQNWSTSATAWGDEIYKSTNGGQTWTAMFSSKKMKLDRGEFVWADSKIKGQGPLSLHWATCIVIDPFNAERAFVVSGNGVFMTNNLSGSPSTWLFQVKDLEETVPLGLVSPPYGAPMISVIGDYDGFRNTSPDSPAPLGRHTPNVGSTSTIDFAEQNPGVVVRSGGSAFYSTDNAKTWKLLPLPEPGVKEGSMAVSADGRIFAWSPAGKTVYTTTDKINWIKAIGAPSNQRIISDRVNPQKFYSVAASKLYFSTDGGLNFSASASNGALSQAKKIRTSPNIEGDIWIPAGSSGLYRTIWTDNIPGFKKIAGVVSCEAVGFGKAKEGQTFQAIYIWGKIGTIEGIYRSDDEALTWTRINDDLHEFGGTGNANEIIGDPRVYGRVYMSTAGRAIVYGDLIGGPDEGYIYDTEYLPSALKSPEKSNESLFSISSTKQGIELMPKAKGHYEIYSISGSILEKGFCESPKTIARACKNGIYFVRFISTSGKTESKKIWVNQ